LFLASPPSLYRFWHFASLFILMFSIKDRAFKLNRPHSRKKSTSLEGDLAGLAIPQRNHCARHHSWVQFDG
jgi:hypothetical protein